MESSRIDSKDNPPPPGGGDTGDGGSFPSTQQHRQRDSSSKSSIADHVADILPAIFNRSNAPGSPSDPHVSANSDPLFFNASENSEDFTYVPKKGFGMQKKGDKFHGFTYSCVPNAPRSVAMFGPLIKAASATDDAEVVTYDIYKLANILVAAFSDLVLNANNDDITSYLYLTDFAVHALSENVREALKELKQGFESDGGIALALVTDLVATSNRDTLYERAVEPRDSSAQSLTGIEALNEANLTKVYSALSAKVQTMAVLMTNGVNTDADWVAALVGAAPTLDELIEMKFGNMKKIIDDNTNDTSLQRAAVSSTKQPGPSAHDMDVIHKMYAGMIGTPQNVQAPPVRKNILESGLTLEVSEQLEEMGYYDLAKLDNASIYQVAKETSNAIKNKSEASKSSERSSSSSTAGKSSTSNKITLATFTNKLVSAKQYALKAAKSGTKKIKSKKRMPIGSLIKGTKKAEQGEESLPSPIEEEEEEPASIKEGSAKGGLASLAKGVGKLSSALGGSGGSTAALAAGGPVTAALAIAPAALEVASALQEIVDEREEKLKEEIKETEEREEKIEKEVSALLDSLGPNMTAENVEKKREDVKKLLASVRKPANFGVAPMQGMALAAMAEGLSTKFSDTDMAALQPYKTNEDIAAGVYGGNALKGVCIFMDSVDSISLPTATLLQKPKFVVMAGPAIPFCTKTVRMTSERAMDSFINSTINSSFSTAKKSKKSSSHSHSATGSNLLGSVTTSGQGANVVSDSNNQHGSNVSDFYQDMKEKGTEAFVCEFCFMPTKTFRLSEGGLMLSEYAYFKLIGVTDAATAVEFLKSFGSHIPMGNQTLGGVFIRTMKMKTQEETKMSELYSAATVELSKANKEASKSSSSGGFDVGFITTLKVATSASASSVTSSEFTTSVEQAGGGGTTEVTSTATFESNVICHGPNAATPNSFYKQLMTNNATWTMIDRDEPASYLAIWDLIEYIGEREYFGQQCNLLRAEWKRMALENLQRNPGDVELLAELWTFGSFEMSASNFLLYLAKCLIPLDLVPSYSDIADQFGKVVKAGAASAQSVPNKSDKPGGAFGSPMDLIIKGAHAAEENLLFRVCKDCPEYEIAKALMSSFSSSQWKSFDSTDLTAIMNEVKSLAKPDRLVKLCKQYFDTGQFNWFLFKDNLNKPEKYKDKDTTDEAKEAYSNRLKKQLGMRDADGLTCAHYLTKDEDDNFFWQVVMLCPDCIIPYGEKGDIVDYVNKYGTGGMKSFINRNIYGDFRNVALGKKATQSNPYMIGLTNMGPASKAVDGVTYYDTYNYGSCSAADDDVYDGLKWWEVELDGTYHIHAIRIYTAENQFQSQLKNFHLSVIGENGFDRVWRIFQEKPLGYSHKFELPDGVVGTKVMISRSKKKDGDGRIVMNEVQVFGRAKRK